jgi:hypothetical protein
MERSEATPIRRSPNGARHRRPQVIAIARNGGRDPSERPVVINWNDWSRSIGIAGRHQPVRARGDRPRRDGRRDHDHSDLLIDCCRRSRRRRVASLD